MQIKTNSHGDVQSIDDKDCKILVGIVVRCTEVIGIDIECRQSSAEHVKFAGGPKYSQSYCFCK